MIKKIIILTDLQIGGGCHISAVIKGLRLVSIEERIWSEMFPGVEIEIVLPYENKNNYIPLRRNNQPQNE